VVAKLLKRSSGGAAGFNALVILLSACLSTATNEMYVARSAESPDDLETIGRCACAALSAGVLSPLAAALLEPHQHADPNTMREDAGNTANCLRIMAMWLPVGRVRCCHDTHLLVQSGCRLHV
jgi:hypothetical protein